MHTIRQRKGEAAPELSGAIKACRGALAATGLFTSAINILMLTGSLFMLQVYDRVLPSRSIPTLLALVIIVIGLYLAQGLLEAIRMRVLSRIARTLDDRLNEAVYSRLLVASLRNPASVAALQPVRDLDQVRGFLSGAGPTAFFDLPWMPFYLAICFAFHFWIGTTALAGAIILIAITLLTEFLTKEPGGEANLWSTRRIVAAEASRRNAEAIHAMGMGPRAVDRWLAVNARYVEVQQRLSDVGGGLSSLSKILRMFLQSAVLAVGAYLVINQQATGGIIIASSILVSRALAPVELAIANWKGFVGARQAWRRLSETLGKQDGIDQRLELPPPVKSLSVESVNVVPPAQQRAVVQEASFSLQAGQGLGIIGPSASGKSSLARALVGVWRPARGVVRLDNAALDQWQPDLLGRHIGYLPQDIELFDGTVADNIARLEPMPDPARVIEAAQAAGAHDLILRLPDGYETRIGEAGMALSAGQRQRVALARALYGNPFFVVLDEPNSNLDAEGDEALTQAIRGIRQRGGVVVVIAHRPSALMGVDLVLAMANGRVQAFGPKDEVLGKVIRPVKPKPLVVMDTEAPAHNEAAGQ